MILVPTFLDGTQEARAARREVEEALGSHRWPWSRGWSRSLDALVALEEGGA